MYRKVQYRPCRGKANSKPTVVILIQQIGFLLCTEKFSGIDLAASIAQNKSKAQNFLVS